MTQALHNLGHRISRSTVSRWMREVGLAAKTRRKFVVTTDSKHSEPVAENQLARNFSPEDPGQALASDITYVRTIEGWLFLAVTMDLFSRRVAGWSMAHTMTSDLVINALRMAMGQVQASGSAIHHSARDSQYASADFQSELLKNGLTASMSRKGNCWDNAPVESFFHTLKTEHIYFENFKEKDERGGKGEHF